MKREIRFRRWAKHCSEMVYSCGVYLENFFRVIDDDIADGTDKYIIMQYTGLNDKNGNGIYEDDVVCCDWLKRHYPVFWDKNNCSFKLKTRNEVNNASLTIWNKDEIEVIGNIHENPELLKS